MRRLLRRLRAPRDEISPALARVLAGQIAAGLVSSAGRHPTIGAYERAMVEERERARTALMVAGGMLAGSTSDKAALETLELAGRMYRDETGIRLVM